MTNANGMSASKLIWFMLLDSITNWRCFSMNAHRGPRRQVYYGQIIRLVRCESCGGGWLERHNGEQRVWLGSRAFTLSVDTLLAQLAKEKP